MRCHNMNRAKEKADGTAQNVEGRALASALLASLTPERGLAAKCRICITGYGSATESRN